MKDELWIKRLKERLDDYSEPLSDKGWEQLEKKLTAFPPRKSNISRRIVFRRWVVAAAAVLIVAISSIALWFLQSPVADDVRRDAEPTLAVLPDVLPGQPEVDTKMEKSVPAQKYKEGSASHSRPLVARNVGNHRERSVEKEENLLQEGNPDNQSNVKKRISEENRETTEQEKEHVQQSCKETKSSEASSERREERRKAYRSSGKDKFQLPLAGKKTSRKKGWSFGVSVGNAGALAATGSTNNSDYVMASPSPGLINGNLNLADMSNGVVSIPEGEQLFFKNGMPYLSAVENEVDINHKQPISFGISIRKGLSNNFSVETGLTYTLLASEIRYNRSSDLVKQNLHYVGIPLRFNWSFLDKRAFLLYLSAGGMVEKCVYGEIGSYKETVDPLQFSLLSAFGVQYKLSRRIGLYLEPGVSYFFDDGSSIETIRKEHSFDFTLQAGIRFSY